MTTKVTFNQKDIEDALTEHLDRKISPNYAKEFTNLEFTHFTDSDGLAATSVEFEVVDKQS